MGWKIKSHELVWYLEKKKKTLQGNHHMKKTKGYGHLRYTLTRLFIRSTLLDNIIQLLLLAAHPCCESPVPPHPKGALLKWGSLSTMNWLSSTINQLEILKNSYRRTVHWSERDGHGQQQSSGRLWRLSDAHLVVRDLKSDKKTPPTPHQTCSGSLNNRRQDGSILSCCVWQILNLLSKYHSNNIMAQ